MCARMRVRLKLVCGRVQMTRISILDIRVCELGHTALVGYSARVVAPPTHRGCGQPRDVGGLSEEEIVYTLI